MQLNITLETNENRHKTCCGIVTALCKGLKQKATNKPQQLKREREETNKEIYIYPASRRSIIRTRLKISIFGIFWFVVLERRQPYFVLRTKIFSKISDFQVAKF